MAVVAPSRPGRPNGDLRGRVRLNEHSAHFDALEAERRANAGPLPAGVAAVPRREWHRRPVLPAPRGVHHVCPDGYESSLVGLHACPVCGWAPELPSLPALAVELVLAHGDDAEGAVLSILEIVRKARHA